MQISDWYEIDAVCNICHPQYILVFKWAPVFANRAATYSKHLIHCIAEKVPIGHPIKHLNTTVIFFKSKIDIEDRKPWQEGHMTFNPG